MEKRVNLKVDEEMKEDIFITNIHIGSVRHLQHLDVEISETAKKHLILTGKNGSGKTSLLDEMAKCFNILCLYSDQPEQTKKYIYEEELKKSGLDIKFNIDLINKNFKNTFIFLYIKALRSLKNMKLPSTITKEANIINTINKNREIAADTSEDFLQRMVNLYFMQLSAEKKQDFEKAKILENWFANFIGLLKKIYACDTLKLDYDDDNFEYKIILPDREPFGLKEMSDGYSAILKIVIEIINLMEAKSGNYCDYTMSGIVLIDEIDAHSHIELQKEIMPFLIEMFPNVQFIVSTHSPFVISSIKNAVIFDLENKRRVEDLSAYSWETVVESYFEAGQYSHIITEKFNKYRELYKKERSHDEEKEFLRARAELATVISPAQKELYNAFSQMELNLRGRAGK
jgi:predicted ATP-binding protein involved in virulence